MITAVSSSAHPIHLKPVQTETILQRVCNAVAQFFKVIAGAIKAACDAFLGLFLPNRTIKPLSTPTPPSSPRASSGKIFLAHDYDYSGYSEKDVSDLQFAENCCCYPKLALAATKQREGLDMHTACRLLNAYTQTVEMFPPLKLSAFIAFLDQQQS